MLEAFDEDEPTRDFKRRENGDLAYVGKVVFAGKVLIGIAAGFSMAVVGFFVWLVLSITGMEGKIDTLTGVVNARLDAQGQRIETLERKDGRQ
jgi:hypothetical protein